ncbi:MAG: cupin domain-containing protein [Sphingopyxis sp.]|uniref:cupin domain-containing protein n=1 Tax=Sphingopyxis sp. TaxID=1908224 RepID=UPI003D6D103C
MAEQDQARMARSADALSSSGDGIDALSPSGDGPSLAELVAPLSVAEFLAQHWNRSFRAWPGRAGRFSALIDWDDINHILSAQRLEPPQLILVRGGKNVPVERFTHVSGSNRRIDAGATTAQLAQGATLVLSFVDEMVKRIGDLADRLGGDLGARCNVNLYAGWRADHGFDLHWDHHDVFILQIAGRKHWRVQRPTRDHPARGEIVPPPAADDAPVYDDILEEGGVLYIPRGWWHVATPVEEPSLHLTLAITPPTGQDYLRWLVGKAAAEAVFRADWPVAGGDAATAAYWGELGAAMQRLHAAHPPEAFLAEQQASRVARPLFTLPDFAAGTMARLSPDSRLRLAGARALARVHDAVSGDEGLDIGGRIFACSAAVGSVLGRLSSERDTRFAVLTEGLGDAVRRELEQLLIRLVATGAIFVDPGLDQSKA